ncbi:hypothetical protein H4P12_01090 [Paracoccus sp. 11-3]|uniref:Uncharacterized protein n=1 Tax=Paracoccus amoyensis TaxID=2760093 RepID=A0A926JAZ4_9RHOB|nr:hypothetical protein [Paracoccus amoyensis]
MLIAILLVGIGAYRQFGTSSVSAADQARCEQLVRDEYGSDAENANTMLANCNDPGMIAMMDARASGAGAEQAASSIAAANQTDLFSMMINYALIGAGIGALMVAFAPRKKRA